MPSANYARAPEMQFARFSLNQLVTEVADLYRSHDPRTGIRLDLDERIDGHRSRSRPGAADPQ